MTTALDVAPLRLGPGVVADPPVVLAPMAGITNTAFRRLCREAMATELAPGQAGGLFVSEMITSRALVERNPKTLQLIRFEPDESPRSIQLYGVDPAVVGAAVRMIVDEDLADHVDLNFGCPVPKVTRKGGGAALPFRIGLFDDIVRAAVREARGAVPGHRQDARRHRRRPSHLPRGRPAGAGRRGRARRPARAHRRGVLRRARRLDAYRRPRRPARHPGARQRRHLGGRGRRPHDPRDRLRRRRRRPRLPRPAVAVRRPGRRLRRRVTDRVRPPSAPSPPRCTGTPSCSRPG